MWLGEPKDMSDEGYKCSLTENSLQKAKDELGEDPDERLGAVQTLRERIQREEWINAPTGWCNIIKVVSLELDKSMVNRCMFKRI